MLVTYNSDDKIIGSTEMEENDSKMSMTWNNTGYISPGIAYVNTDYGWKELWNG